MPVYYSENEMHYTDNYFDVMYTAEEQKLLTEKEKEEYLFWITKVPDFVLLKRFKEGYLYIYKEKELYFLPKEKFMDWGIYGRDSFYVPDMSEEFKLSDEDAFNYLLQL